MVSDPFSWHEKRLIFLEPASGLLLDPKNPEQCALLPHAEPLNVIALLADLFVGQNAVAQVWACATCLERRIE